jgi:hypothetical protein
MYLENRMIALLDVLALSDRIDTKEKMLATLSEYKRVIAKAKEWIVTPSPNGTYFRLRRLEDVHKDVFAAELFYEEPSWYSWRPASLRGCPHTHHR